MHQTFRRGMPGRLSAAAIGTMVALATFTTGSAVQAAGAAPAASAARPNHFDPTSRAASSRGATVATTLPTSGRRGGAGHPPQPALAMQPGTLAIDPSQPGHFMGSDGTLELEVPAGAVSAADVAAAGGKMSLLVRQVAPASGGTSGGSGHLTFGTFLVQVLDAKGGLARRGLRRPLGIVLHVAGRARAADLAHTVAIINAPLPRGTDLAPTTAAAARKMAAQTPALGRTVTQRPAVDAQAQTLSTSADSLLASTTVSFATAAPVAAFGGVDRAQANLSSGSLALPVPLRLPAGPGGLTPPLSLMYDSASVNDQHDPAAAAPWVGEGWNLSLGAISWTERDTAQGCCPNPNFNDTWNLMDSFGTRAELIPPATSVSTYYEDSNGTSITPSPVTWRTTPETHARVISFQGSTSLPGMSAVPPCFRVFLPSGIMEEFGCTPDSLQFFPQSSGPDTGLDFIANWLLDLITDPQGNQVHVTYQQDIQTGAAGISYPRDAVMATVEYDSPGCHNAQAACTGAAWAPLMRVSFQASHSVARVAGSGCAANGSLRCDDPVDLSGSGGLASPTVESTFVLNDALVQVRASGTAAWNTLRDYRLAYDQSGPSTITDPFSGVAQSTAGRLLLTRLTEIGADGSLALPSRSFSYTKRMQYYEDVLWAPAPASNCGPSWNVGTGQGCNLWSQSYEGNSYYLSTLSNGLGLQQSFTWQLARDNFDGVPSGQDVLDPFVCDRMQSTSPCDRADDGSWSRMVLTQRSESIVRLTQSGQGGAQTSTTVTSTYSYTYRLMAIDDYWGDFFDTDVVDFYNGKFMGFGTVTVTNPDGAGEVHQFPQSEGFGVFDPSNSMFANLCTTANPCAKSPWWDAANALHGQETEVDSYNPDGSLQEVVQTQYSAQCPSSGVSGDMNGQLVSELDAENPVALCEVKPTQVDRFQVDGGSQSSAPHLTTTYAYDAYGRLVSSRRTANDGGGGGSPTTVVAKTSYTWNDSVSASATSATGTYLIDVPAFADVEDSSGNRYRCRYASYDGQANVIGQTTGLTLAEPTRTDTYTSCGTSANNYTPSGQLSATSVYDAFGNVVAADDADALAGSSAHVGCTLGSSTYSRCATYDGTFRVLPASSANALNQRAQTGYQAPASGTATGGFGLWPVSATDANGQTTTFTYDALGRTTSATLPGEGSGLTTRTTAYTVWCASTGAQSPCVEIDRTQRLNGTTTVTVREFYDGLGRLVETRAPAPGGKDVVSYRFYDASQRLAFQSQPYLVAAYTGGPGAAAFSIPDSTQAGATSTYDGLGRLASATDALSQTIATAYTVVCNTAGTGDSACYEQKLTTDAAGHRGGTLLDAMGRIDYEQRYTGSSASTYAVYATIKYAYDFVGNLTQVLHPDGTTRTTATYDMAGRVTATTDPDAGAQTFTYDASGNLVQSVDARGAAGTVFYGYDGIDRPLWHNTQNSPTGAYYTYSYDSTAGGNAGVGRLTGETFTNGTLSGSYALMYDGRGQQAGVTLAVAGTAYPMQATFDDAGHPLTQSYPDGEMQTNSYTAQGWLSGVSTRLGATTTTLLSGAVYTGVGGALGDITGAALGSAYQYSAVDDLMGRPADRKVTATSGGSTVFDDSVTYDAAGNVASRSTTLPAGTDNQQFCYDEQNRLTWAGSTGTPPCTGTAIGAGTLTAAQYAQSFTYDTLGRLATGPLGSYGYGSAGHVHAATAVGTGYTAAYDAAGDMTCRAPTTSTTCAGASPTGAQLSYNNEGQLVGWQSTPSSPTSAEQLLYDCQGRRVAQTATSGGTTTTTVYVGGLEEVVTSGSTTTTKTYYSAGGRLIAMAVNGTFSFLARDGLGSVEAVLGASGGAVAAQLYAPYGALRYSTGSSPTSYGFTGQRADATTGLSYYGSRYYDPAVGQFATADSVMPGGGFNLEGLSRYAYTRGNPTSRTDPTGHDDFGGGDFGGGDFGGGDFGGGFDAGGGFDTGGDGGSGVDSSGGDAIAGGIGGGAAGADVAPGGDSPQPISMTDALANAEGPQLTPEEVSAAKDAVTATGQAAGSFMTRLGNLFSTTDGENMMVTPDEVDAAKNLVSAAGNGIAGASGSVLQSLGDLYQVTDGENMMVTQQELDACRTAGCSGGISLGGTFVTPWTGGGSAGVNLQYTQDNGLQLFGYYTPASELGNSGGFQIGVGVELNYALGHGGWDGPFANASVSADIVTLGGFQSATGVTPTNGYVGGTFALGLGTPGASFTTTNYTCLLGCGK